MIKIFKKLKVRGTVHIPGPRQDFEKLKNNTKKQRALTRAMPEKEIDSEDEAEFEQDIEMEEVEWNRKSLLKDKTVTTQ